MSETLRQRLACRLARRHFSAYLEGDLDPAAVANLERHLDACPDCHRSLDAEQELARRLRAAAPPAPSLSPKKAAAMRRNLEQGTASRSRLHRLGGGLASAALIAILLLAAGLFRSWLPALAPAPAGATSITFAVPAGERPLYRPLVESFNESQQEVRVSLVALPGDGGPVSVARASAEADAFVAPFALTDANISSLLDLETAGAALDPADFWPGALAACHGRGLPLRLTLDLMLYDPASLRAAGLSAPANGWSWAQFAETVRHLGQVHGGPVYAPAALPAYELNPVLAHLVTTSGGEVAGSDLTATAGWYVSLFHEGLIANTFNFDAGAAAGLRQRIARREVPLWIAPLGQLAAQQAQARETGVVAFPVASNVSRTTPARADCLAISAASSAPAAAWEWLSYLSKAPVAWPDRAAPARSALAAAYWQDLDAPAAAAIRFALEHAWYPQHTGALDDLQGVIHLALYSGRPLGAVADGVSVGVSD